LSTLKAKDVEKALCKKGFEKSNTDHRVFWFYIDGARTNIHTKISHNSQDIDDYLQSCMARQMQLTKNDFLLFVSCQMNFKTYIERIKSSGVLK